MKKNLLLVPIAVLAFAGTAAQAQNRTISGRVTDRTSGEGLPGVTVLVKGTTTGVSTNSDGTFTLSAPAGGGTLVYSSVGYISVEQPIGDSNTINAALATDSKALSEVVVVGYGSAQNRRELTGSIATVTAAQIANKPVQSFEQALQGQAAGVNITTPNGVLNASPVVRIRGVNSITLSSAPLYVIDGIPAFSGNSSAVGSVPNNPLSNINPADIESVEVLKDASATAIYGSRAAGGVIVVTTKKGRRGQSKLSLDSWVGWNDPVRLYDVLNATDYMEIKNEAVRNLNANRVAIGSPQTATNIEGFRPTLDASGNIVDTRWYDYIYRTGFSSSNTLNFSGGTEKTTYYTSVGYTDQKGMLENNTFKRASARLNIDHKVFSRLSVGARVAYTNARTGSPNSGSVGDGAFGTAGLGRAPLVLPPNIAPRNPDGTYNINGAGIGAGANINPASYTVANPNGQALLTGFFNPLVDLENNYFLSEGNDIQGSVYADLEPVKGLHLRTNYGIYNIAFEDKSFSSPIAGDSYNVGSAFNFYRTNKRWNWQNTAQYDVTLAEKHNISILAGTEYQSTQIDRWGANRTSVSDPFFTTFQGGYSNIANSGSFQGENFLMSYFGRATYNFNRKYLATFNARRDGYSAWGNEKWGNFYGASLGYIVSEEAFWKNSSFLNTISLLKFTGSYGEVGNNQGIGDFTTRDLYSPGLYGTSNTFFFSNAGNADLSWETSKKTDVGLSFGLFEDRIQGDVAYYRNDVDGLILDVPQSPSKGIPNNAIAANIGSMRNTGVEFNLRATAINKADFTWSINANLTTLKNRVTKLATEGQRIGTATSGLETVNFTRVGGSVGEILAVQSLGVNPENGRRMIRKADGTVVQYNHQGQGWTLMDGTTTTPAPSQLADGQYYGPTLPTWYGGFDNTFRYKSFDLGVFIQFSGGNYIYNGTKAGLHDQRFWNNATDIKDRWTETNRNAEWPRVVYGDNVSNGSALVMSSNVEKGDFARLRNVSLGYNVASGLVNKLGVGSARLYVQVQNAALLTNYSGIDPEISTNGSNNTGAGVDRNSVGQARSYTVGLNLGF
ncbi:SusC/RagA family TonB-linked outer membrane protein [Hymenobacter swuensis]|uniref:TonB-dependent receptor n=1 Tax=Hymenobacter swuensis DY53 TaxID=1227739 RepID=W8EUI6_9BACT|nr:TonB-dependent receptor [Hymenobacter swuensis]AHJ96193.1 TonB-dependent receptor [Hymenobacter swuensis DY53]